MSHLSRYCLGVMEAAWLAAVAVIPVFFNRHSEKMFDPDKVALLQGFTMLVLTAWFVRSAELLFNRESRPKAEDPSPMPSCSKTPVSVGERVGSASASKVLTWFGASYSGGIVLALLLALTYVVAAWFSVDPILSWQGSYDNAQGVYTSLSYLVLFTALATQLRRVEQVNRLVTVAVSASWLVALYAIVQRAGYDPVNFAKADNRVFSTLGQPVYLAAYLGMVFPLTLWRIWTQLERCRMRPAAVGTHAAALAFYLLTSVAQLLALVLTESRGPLLGLVASITLLAILLASFRQRRRLLLAPVVVVALPVLLLLFLSSGASGLETWRSSSLLERYLAIFRPDQGTGSFRTELWKQAPGLVLPSSPLPFPGGGDDPHNWLRTFVGYGPETLSSVLPHHYSVLGPDPTIENRFHNLTWDLWSSIGVVGLLAFLAAVLWVFFNVYRHLRLVSTRGEGICFWALVAGSAGAGVLALTAWQGLGYAGLGLQVGLVSGLAAYPLIRLLTKDGLARPGTAQDQNAVLLMVLLSALAGHLIETGFSFEVAPTAVLFWVCMGLTLALIEMRRAGPEAEAPRFPPESQPVQGGRATPGRLPKARPSIPAPRTSSTRREVGLAATMTSLIALPLLMSFIHVYSSRELPAAEILSFSLTKLDGRQGSTAFTLLLLMLTWLGAALALTADRDESRSSKAEHGQFRLVVTSSGLLLGVCAFLKACQLSVLGPFPAASASGWIALHQCLGYEWLYLTEAAVILALVVLNGFFCGPPSIYRPQPTAKSQLCVGLGACLVLLAWLWFSNFNRVRADICLHWAEALHAQQVRPASLEVYQRAVQLCPSVFVYRSKLAEALSAQAEAASNTAAFNDWMAQATRVLLDAQALGTLNRGAYHLGELYTIWAAHETEPARKSELAKNASQAFDRALVFEPRTESAWTASANLDELFLERPNEAVRKRNRAQELVRHQDAVAFGEAYLDKSRFAPSPDLQRCEALQALAYFDLAASNALARAGNGFPSLMGKAKAWLLLSDPAQALASSVAAAKAAPSTNLWQAEELSAIICGQLNNKTAALDHADRAIKNAPAQVQAALARLKQQIQTLP